MSGIYLHIPYCRRKCGYCNFYSIAGLRREDDFTEAICMEARRRSVELGEAAVNTIYFGGGTPSLLRDSLLAKIMDCLKREFSISEKAEVTLEANPDDLELNRAITWRDLGINRLSIGVQSYYPEDLAFLDRVHNTEQALGAVETSMAAGIENLSIDLIYGIPGQDDHTWNENLEQFFRSGAGHLSAYALTLEHRTKYFRKVEKGTKEAPDGDQAFRHFMILHQKAKAEGFEHYEVSNLCRPGQYSRHNTAYWQGIPYLGLGPSAHSFDGKQRSWNISHHGRYIEKNGDAVEEREILGPNDHLNEYLMTSLRTRWGCNKEKVMALGGSEAFQNIERGMAGFIERSWAEDRGDHWVLTPVGFFHADGISSSLFMI